MPRKTKSSARLQPNLEVTSVKILRRVGKTARESDDHVAREEPLEIRVRGQSVAVTMRTPGHDDELAAGFLLSEGMIQQRSDVKAISACQQSDTPENTLNIFLTASVQLDLTKLTRHVFASSSCGLCGKASIEAIHAHFSPVESTTKIKTKTILRLPDLLRWSQKTFAQTGGLHAAGIFTTSGRLIVAREDVGRHNAVDKVIGHCFLRGLLPLEKHVLMVSGRTSFEIMQKALAARVAIVCAVSAPTSLAVEFARESGQTLVGFLRGDTMNIYSHAQRCV